MKPLTVLIVDDDLFVRETLAEFLASQGIDCAGTCVDGESALAYLARESTPSAVLLDVRMPGLGGLATLAGIRANHPGVPVLMLTSFDEDATIEQSMREGAAGFVLKNVRPVALGHAVRSAVAGLTVMSTPVAQRVWAVRRVRGAPQSLTERERAVLAAVCAGDSNAAIAGALFLSETSVKQVIVALQRSFGVSNRIQLAIRGSALGLDTA